MSELDQDVLRKPETDAEGEEERLEGGSMLLIPVSSKNSGSRRPSKVISSSNSRSDEACRARSERMAISTDPMESHRIESEGKTGCQGERACRTRRSVLGSTASSASGSGESGRSQRNMGHPDRGPIDLENVFRKAKCR